MSAKATDPLMVPAIETTDNYLNETVHFFDKSLQMIDNTKMEVALEIMQTRSSKRIKVIENT